MPSREQFPKTVRGWIEKINTQGVSNRPVPNRSDLVDPNYRDPEGIKEERTVLSGIICIRAYQRAKRLLLTDEATFSSPRCKDIPKPQEIPLLEKSIGIGKVFTQAMAICLLEDEKRVKANPAHPANSIYQRLEYLWEPVVRYISPESDPFFQMGERDQLFRNPSPAFREVMTGVLPLNNNIRTLLLGIYLDYHQKYQRMPETEEVKEIASNSYETLIKKDASLHSDDGTFLNTLDYIVEDKERPIGLNDEDRMSYKPEIVEKLREYQASRRKERSRTARCAFLLDPKKVKKFLDEPADFDDPLKDAFDLILKFTFA